MFDTLSARFQSAIRTLSGAATLTDANTRDALDIVRAALLDADVGVGIASEFCDSVRARVLGSPVPPGVTPAQAFIAACHAELVRLLDPDAGDADSSRS